MSIAGNILKMLEDDLGIKDMPSSEVQSIQPETPNPIINPATIAVSQEQPAAPSAPEAKDAPEQDEPKGEPVDAKGDPESHDNTKTTPPPKPEQQTWVIDMAGLVDKIPQLKEELGVLDSSASIRIEDDKVIIQAAMGAEDVIKEVMQTMEIPAEALSVVKDEPAKPSTSESALKLMGCFTKNSDGKVDENIQNTPAEIKSVMNLMNFFSK